MPDLPGRRGLVAPVTLGLALLAAGCTTRIAPGQFTCVADQPGSCPPGWLCQCRGAGCDWRCWQDTASFCGNDVRDDGEECDGSDFGGQTCASLGRGDGFMYCRPDCTIACTVCGNGVVESTPTGAAEACDLGAANSDQPNASCRTDCLPQRCGDGVLDDLANEECDPGDAAHAPDLGGATCESHGYYGGTLSCLSNCRFSLLGCAASCGDGVKNGSEVCDGNDFGDDTCTARGFYGGRLRCSDDCQAVLTDECRGRCGDGARDAVEECDPGDASHAADLGGASCESLGYHPGTLACAADCTFDFTGCSGRCGDGVKDGAEACDPGDGTHPADLGGADCGSLGYYAGTLACLPNCQLDLTDCRGQCGDGVKNGGEVCDGNDFGDDTCTARGYYGGTLRCGGDCQSVLTVECHGRCGDGTLDPVEACDPGDLTHPPALGGATCATLGYHPGTLACRADCRFDLTGCGGRCGDGVKDPTEQCDGTDLGTPAADCTTAGYYRGTLACLSNCQFDVRGCSGLCGDGVKDASETCDAYDFGALTCQSYASPRGGTFYAGYLTCRDACSSIDTTHCSQYCGDGLRNGLEPCDPGDPSDPAVPPDLAGATCETFGYYSGTLACEATCAAYDRSGCFEFCGDGLVNGAEQCDGLAQSGLSCVGFGYDGGALRCSSYCLPLTELCVQAGWQTMATGTPTLFAVGGSRPTDAWAVGAGGAVWHYDGSAWAPGDSGTGAHLRGVWAASPGSAYAVGDGGTVRRWDGTGWAAMSPGTAAQLTSVWGSGAEVFAVGQTSAFKGTIVHWDGTSWSTTTLPPGFMFLQGVWGSGPSDVFAVGGVIGGPAVYHYNGTTWSPMTLPGGIPAGTSFYGVGGSGPGDVWAVGDTVVLHYNGTAWSAVPSPATARLRAVWAIGPGDVFAVGEQGLMMHYNGVAWSGVDSGTTATLTGVWGSGPGDLFAVGWGVILHYEGPGLWSTAQTMYAVGGTSQTDVYAVGNGGSILRYDGVAWRPMTSNTGATLYGVWASSSSPDVFAAGANGATGTVVRHDGTAWSVVLAGAPAGFNAIWGSGPLDVFAVGGTGVIYHYDGTWQSMPNPMASDTGSRWLTAVWGTGPNDVYAVGERSSGTVSAMHYDGTTWSAVAIGNRLRGVWGTGPADVYAVGMNGGLFHYNGTQWRSVSSGVTWNFQEVWGTDPANVFAVGEGMRAVRHFDGAVWSTLDVGTTPLLGLWGTSTGQAFAPSGANALVRFGTVMPTPDGGACARPIVAYCGTSVETSSVGRPAGPTTYSCAGSALSGNPVFYRLDSPVTGQVTVTLTPYERDLDLVVLGAAADHGCDVTQCLGASQRTGLTADDLTIDVVTGRSYYFVVDGPGAGGAYGLTVACTKQ